MVWFFLFFQRTVRIQELQDALVEVSSYKRLFNLKELYTSISTLAQKLVLTLLNNEFILKIQISTPFGRKIRERFRLKKHKSQISG